jgi:hypothetical protein
MYIRCANLVFNPIFLHKKQIPLVAVIQLPQRYSELNDYHLP